VLHTQTAVLRGLWITDLFGAASLKFARWVEKQETVTVERKAALHAALDSLPTD